MSAGALRCKSQEVINNEESYLGYKSWNDPDLRRRETALLIPVTVLQAGPCVVTQVKTVENDGYSAVQVGFVDKKEKDRHKRQQRQESRSHTETV